MGGFVSLDPKATVKVEVDFDPSYKVDRQSAVMEQKLSVGVWLSELAHVMADNIPGPPSERSG